MWYAEKGGKKGKKGFGKKGKMVDQSWLKGKGWKGKMSKGKGEQGKTTSGSPEPRLRPVYSFMFYCC